MKFSYANALCRLSSLPFFGKITTVSYKYSKDSKHLYCEESSEVVENIEDFLVSKPNLETIDARSCGISQIYLYIEDFHLYNLHTAIFSHNKIESIGIYCFYSLKGLKTLNLSNNIITKFGEGAFNFLRKLEILDLSNNFITYIDSSSFKHLYQLKEFYFANNQLQHLRFELFYNSPHLKIMNYSSNKIEKVTFFEIVWENMTILDLSNNLISQLDPNTTAKYFPNLKWSGTPQTSNVTIAELIEKTERATRFLIFFITIITILDIVYHIPAALCF
jgi:BspA type Leucine rich repeat region (6 copies)